MSARPSKCPRCRDQFTVKKSARFIRFMRVPYGLKCDANLDHNIGGRDPVPANTRHLFIAPPTDAGSIACLCTHAYTHSQTNLTSNTMRTLVGGGVGGWGPLYILLKFSLEALEGNAMFFSSSRGMKPIVLRARALIKCQPHKAFYRLG